MAHKVPQGFGPWVKASGVMLSVLNLADVTPEAHCGGHNNITSTKWLHHDKSTPYRVNSLVVPVSGTFELNLIFIWGLKTYRRLVAT